MRHKLALTLEWYRAGVVTLTTGQDYYFVNDVQGKDDLFLDACLQ
jgi:hypothetical protein